MKENLAFAPLTSSSWRPWRSRKVKSLLEAPEGEAEGQQPHSPNSEPPDNCIKSKGLLKTQASKQSAPCWISADLSRQGSWETHWSSTAFSPVALRHPVLTTRSFLQTPLKARVPRIHSRFLCCVYSTYKSTPHAQYKTYPDPCGNFVSSTDYKLSGGRASSFSLLSTHPVSSMVLGGGEKRGTVLACRHDLPNVN